jgi:hypothetical protein
MLIEVVILLSLPHPRLAAAKRASRRDDRLRATPKGLACRLVVASPGWVHCDAGPWHQLKVHANRDHSRFLIISSQL